MSRRHRKGAVHYAFGIVQLRCPQGHEAGKVLRQPYGGYHFYEGAQRIDDESGKLLKIRTRCASCEAEGRRPDLQAAWEPIRLILEAIEPDPTRATVDHQIGG